MFSLILIDLSHEQLYHLSKFQKRFGKYENKIYEISDFMQNMLNPLTVCKQKLLNPHLPIVIMIGSFVPAWNLLTNQEAAHIDCHTQHHCIHSHLPRFMRLDSVYVCVCECVYVCVHEFVCLCMCMCVRMCVGRHVCMCLCVRMCMHVYVSLYACMCVHVCDVVCMFVCVCMCACVCMCYSGVLESFVCARLYAHVYVNGRMCVCMYVCECVSVCVSLCVMCVYACECMYVYASYRRWAVKTSYSKIF